MTLYFLIALMIFGSIKSYTLPISQIVDGERTKLTLQKIINDHKLLVSSSKATSPGIVGHFKSSKGTVVIQLYQKVNLKNEFYATIYAFQGNVSIHDLHVGDQAETDVQLSYSEADFWSSLQNIYLGSRDNWVAQALINNRISGIVGINEPVLIDLQKPPINGYICVLAIYPQRQVEVIYPNELKRGRNHTKVIANKPFYNLSYDLSNQKTSALINTGIAFDKQGEITILVLLSEIPRPLSDFLPEEADTYLYWDIEHSRMLDPRDFGPGFWEPYSRRESASVSVDNIPSYGWAIGRVEIEVRR